MTSPAGEGDMVEDHSECAAEGFFFSGLGVWARVLRALRAVAC